MQRLFLDANVLFSAAYRQDAGVRRLWAVADTVLLASGFAVAEARRNLDRNDQRAQLDELLRGVGVVAESPEHMQWARSLVADKDAPVPAAARACAADMLVTGDLRHFGALMERSDLPLRVCRVRDVV